MFPPTRLLKDLKTTEETPAHSPWWLTPVAHAARRLADFRSGAARAESRPAELRRPRPPPPRHRQWLGVGRALAGAARGDRGGDRPRRPRRPHRRARAHRARPADQRSHEPRAGARARWRAEPRALRARPRRARRRARKAARRQDRLQRAVAVRRSRLWRGRCFRRRSAKLAGANGSLAVLRPEGDDAALALGQASGDRRRARRPRPERRRRPALGRGQGADRPRRAARRSRLLRSARARARPPPISTCRSRSAIRWRASRSPASARPAPCICSMPARNGIASASSRANRARPRSRCSRRSIMCSARSRLTPTSSRPARATSPTPSTSLIEQKVSTIVLADIGKLVAGTQEELEAWLKSGGVLIRFAGPAARARRRRIAAGGAAPRRPLARRLAVLEHAAAARAVRGEEPVPRPYRPRGREGQPAGSRRSDRGQRRRSLGDARRRHASGHRLEAGPGLHRAVPRHRELRLVESAAVGPVRGDAPPRRDARPEPGHDRHRRQDATVEASPAASATPAASTSALPPLQTLDGFGQLDPPPLRAAPIAPDKLDTAVPGPDHPPGYYGPSGAARAFNLITAKTVLKPLGDDRGIERDQRLHHEEAHGARALALSRRHRDCSSSTSSPCWC